jgi:hypothetical protein
MLSGPTPEERSAAAKVIGRLGGLKGGPARHKKLGPDRCAAIARAAARRRWELHRARVGSTVQQSRL